MSASRPSRVLFLPYQAAMWDSLASIWRAAHLDPQADAKVVPIPYDTLTPDGDVARHCPGEQLPPDVPTQDAQSFSVEDFRPDVIYVHNVYDDYNLVTRVAAPFRTDALRRSGATIVYVPYYLVGPTLPPGQRDLPGYRNVDAIVVQTPHHIPQLAAPHQHKALALGTPKADHVVRAAVERRPQTTSAGSSEGPVTVLLTTSITEVLAHNERALTRTWEAIDVAARDANVSLIWRPHPLLVGTLVAMRPHLKEFYAQMLRGAAALPNVTLDLGSDYVPALTAADCYIGLSPTSLALLAGILGMPVLMLDSATDPATEPGQALSTDPSFGDLEHYLPWACAEVNGDVSVAGFLAYASRGHHDRERQRQVYESAVGPLDGRVGARIHARVSEIVRA